MTAETGNPPASATPAPAGAAKADTPKRAASQEGRRSLVQSVAETLRQRILDGTHPAGSRLPTETGLMQDFGVSRTVIREAVATLRYVGLVEPRQGAGVFVLEGAAQSAAKQLAQVDPENASNVLEVLELRRVIEIEAAALAAQRHSPAQESRMLEAFDQFRAVLATGQDTAEADFEFHLAIADATNNPRFRDFQTLLGADLIPRQTFNAPPGTAPAHPDGAEAEREHAAVLNAILARDSETARSAMALHMERAIARYRRLLRQSVGAEPGL